MGRKTPYTLQELLSRYQFDHIALRKLITRHAVKKLGTEQSVLTLDETAFLKKGNQSAGVGRQYCGVIGKVDNAQCGVFLNDSTPQGSTLLDTKLYIKKDWFDEEDKRRDKVKIPPEITYKNKGELGIELVEDFYAQGQKADYVTGDAIYGHSTKLRRHLEQHQQKYVFSVASNFDLLERVSWQMKTAPWRTYASQAPGEKGLLENSWLDLVFCQMEPGYEYRLLVRRAHAESESLRYDIAYVPSGTETEEILEALHRRWSIEVNFKEGKSYYGLSDDEVRSYEGWYRHQSLALLGMFLGLSVQQELKKEQDMTLEITAAKPLEEPALQAQKEEEDQDIERWCGGRSHYNKIKKKTAFNAFLKKRGLALSTP